MPVYDKHCLQNDYKPRTNKILFNQKHNKKSYPLDLKTIKRYLYANNSKEEGHINNFLYNGLKIFFLPIQQLSFKSSYRLGTFIGNLLFRLKIRENIAKKNLDIVFGDRKTLKEKKEIYKKSMENFGRIIINYIRLPNIDKDFWDKNILIENELALKKGYNKNKGLLILAAHYGVWDLGAGKIGYSGYPVSVVAKKIMNPTINKFIIDSRLSMFVGTIANKNTMKRVLYGINNGEGIAMALDQNMLTSSGIYLNWMGYRASSVKSAAFVTNRTLAPALTAHMVQTKPDKFRLIIGNEIVYYKNSTNIEEEIMVNAQIQSDAVQKFILKKPELWLWIHKRWKNQPGVGQNPYSKK